MNHLMKLSRLGKPRATPLCSLMSRNASHFTYVPDAPMENMGKQDSLNNDQFILTESNIFSVWHQLFLRFYTELCGEKYSDQNPRFLKCCHSLITVKSRGVDRSTIQC